MGEVYGALCAGAFLVGWLAARWTLNRYVKREVNVVIRHRDGTTTSYAIILTGKELADYRERLKQAGAQK